MIGRELAAAPALDESATTGIAVPGVLVPSEPDEDGEFRVLVLLAELPEVESLLAVLPAVTRVGVVVAIRLSA